MLSFGAMRSMMNEHRKKTGEALRPPLTSKMLPSISIVPGIIRKLTRKAGRSVQGEPSADIGQRNQAPDLLTTWYMPWEAQAGVALSPSMIMLMLGIRPHIFCVSWEGGGEGVMKEGNALTCVKVRVDSTHNMLSPMTHRLLPRGKAQKQLVLLDTLGHGVDLRHAQRHVRKACVDLDGDISGVAAGARGAQKLLQPERHLLHKHVGRGRHEAHLWGKRGMKVGRVNMRCIPKCIPSCILGNVIRILLGLHPWKAFPRCFPGEGSRV